MAQRAIECWAFWAAEKRAIAAVQTALYLLNCSAHFCRRRQQQNQRRQTESFLEMRQTFAQVRPPFVWRHRQRASNNPQLLPSPPQWRFVVAHVR